MKTQEQTSFFKIAERISASYNEEEDAIILAMLGQEYVVRHDGIFLHGQKAPEAQTKVIQDYLSSNGTTSRMMPWRTISDFNGDLSPDFRKNVEAPIITCAEEIIARMNIFLPMIDAQAVPTISGSDMAINIRALPKVYLHAELSQETQDFSAEAWILFSNNAHEFLTVPSLQLLAETFKDRLLSVLRIY